MARFSFAFRADASINIGTGHVMRCLTLAEALRERGANCYFICRDHPGNMLEFVRQRGFQVYDLPVPDHSAKYEIGLQPAHASWLGVDWGTDADQTLAVLSKIQVNSLIVDHYALDERWERVLRSACSYIMAIDDLADRRHDCDLLLDQNLGRRVDDYLDLVPQRCKILTGAQYALLRPEFAELRHCSLKRRELSDFRRLLITLGGVDKDNVTGRVLETLRHCSFPSDLQITVVMGASAPWLQCVHEIATKMLWPTEVLVNVQDMARLMSESDLAIGAAGSTSWERCCLGLPTILVTLAENQVPIARALDELGAAWQISLETLDGDIKKYIYAINQDRSLLARSSSSAAAVTDGQEVVRVTSTLLDREYI